MQRGKLNKQGASASRPGARASHRAAKASRPKASPPRAREEWHLVCITRKGKVTMLKNLDLRTARETYKRLLPGTHPEKHEFCEECNEKHGGSWSHGYMSSSDSDRLEKIEALGPEGVDLDPWHGVEPRVVFHCDVRKPYQTAQGELKFRPPHKPKTKPEPEWDAQRADFWNNPKLWDSIDPTQRKCWMPEDVQ